MKNRSAILLAVGIGSTGLLIGLLIQQSKLNAAIQEARAAARTANEAAASREKAAAQEPPVLEAPNSRAPALTENPKAPEPPITIPSSTDAAPVPAASQPESLGDRTTWPMEYANKPLADLIADEAHLRQEFEKDIDAECEKRFQDGRNVSYRAGSQPLQGSTSGIQRGKRFDDTYKVVDLDPRVEPELFVKQDKANWLLGEIANRRR